MGGEPTLHPEFRRFTEYLCTKFKLIENDEKFLMKPTKRFIEKRRLMDRQFYQTYHYTYQEGINRRTHGPSLWSSLGSSYYRHYELIQDSFQFQCLNDHNINSFHSPILAARKDLGIPDDEWIVLRDNCWIQNLWSCSITPKGCFFCEIAGTLDWLFDGPGGWSIEPGWWERKPENYGDQLNWCELCGFALKDMPARNANEGIDDVSDTLFEMLKKCGSKKLDKGLVNVIKSNKPQGDKINRRQVYLDKSTDRLTKENQYMYMTDIAVVVMQRKGEGIKSLSDFLNTIIELGNVVSDIIVCADRQVIDELKDYQNSKQIPRNARFVESGITFGHSINRIHRLLGDFSRCLLVTPNAKNVLEFVEQLREYIVNPGVMHYISSKTECDGHLISFDSRNYGSDGYAMLYNTGANALINSGMDRISKCNDYMDFVSLYPEYKRLIIDKNLFEEDIVFDQIEGGKTYAVYGSGELGQKAFNLIKQEGSELAFYIDGDKRKQGTKLYGKEIIAPEELPKYDGEYDVILIATDAVRDVRKTLSDLGIDKESVAPVI